jgi:hypothetical protein
LFNELSELEIYVTPDMNVYKNLILTGMDHLLFRKGLLSTIQVIEEAVYIALNGFQAFDLSEEQTKGRPE